MLESSLCWLDVDDLNVGLVLSIWRRSKEILPWGVE
jgi:hypothetical protein